MDKVNRMRQQQGQAPLSVTPKDQIATPKSTATTVIPRTNNTASPNTTSASQIRTAPKMANDPKRPGLRAGGNSKVYDVQKELIRKGARIQADGVMGPNTQRAITQFFKPDKSNR